MKKITVMLLCLGIVPALTSCSKKKDAVTAVDIQELGQQVGDIMASVDESGGSSGSYASVLRGEEKVVARLVPKRFLDRLDFFPQAHAATCYDASTFSGCTSNVITRDFAGCTIGAATFTGTVTITFADATVDSTCLLTADAHSITRVPDFTVTGRRGATLAVTRTGSVGQKITRASAGVFNFSNDGIRRKFSLPGGVALLDFTSETTSDIGISGNSRASRVMSGGALQVTNNISGTTCNFAPTNVTWDGTCNCAVSGSWAGSCSDGKSTSLSIVSCGQANLTLGDDTELFTFDRCHSI